MPPANDPVFALRAVQRRIGTVYQQFELVSSLRVVHNVNAGRLGEWPVGKAALSLLWPQEVEAAAGALARVGIPEKLYERTDELSGGQQQRVAIARVLAQNPDVILADEPVSNLDPAHSLAIMDLLRDLSAEMGKTLVVSLHAVAYAFSHCDRVIGLRGGRLAFDAPSGAVTQPMIDDLYQVEAGP
jgi:phosphonate transport system ATP-binding protein